MVANQGNKNKTKILINIIKKIVELIFEPTRLNYTLKNSFEPCNCPSLELEKIASNIWKYARRVSSTARS